MERMTAPTQSEGTTVFCPSRVKGKLSLMAYVFPRWEALFAMNKGSVAAFSHQTSLYTECTFSSTLFILWDFGKRNIMTWGLVCSSGC